MEVTHNFIDFTELDEIQLVLWTEGKWEHEENLSAHWMEVIHLEIPQI